ncbi:MAG: DUF4347 domain-containing protein, partial [Desulfuromusa sp.]|nr:DUF4347 domain-containing protein [Desulfuromusa sp.]
MAKKLAKKLSEVFRYEELEPRVLFSADLMPGLDADTDAVYEQVLFEDVAGATQTDTTNASDTAVQAEEIRHELVFVNENVADYEQLIADLQGDDSRIFEVVVLDSDRDGVEQVSEILAERTNLSAIHFITHGADGQINLGDSWLNSTTLSENSAEVASWGEALTETGDILFYGCNLAETDVGQALTEGLAELTGADVTASEDLTGHESLGGDWDLEYKSGDIETDIALTAKIQSSWTEVLAAPVNSVPTAQTTNEDTALVFNDANLNKISISDADAGTDPLEVTLTVNDGILTLSGTTGLTFIAGSNGSATMTYTGTLSDINTALDGLIFTPNADFNGSASLQITTHDDTTLLASYSFDDTGALGADDGPGISYDGTATGATSVNDATRGDVLSLDGTSHVEIPGFFDEPVDVTLAAWVNLTAYDDNGTDIISLGDNLILRYEVWNNSLNGIYYDGATWNQITFLTTTNLAGDGWHHVAYSVDDTNNIHTIYFDGVAVASATTTTSIAYTNGANSYIGAHGELSPQWDLIGLVDDVRIYDRALSAAEIADIMNTSPGMDSGTVAITVIAVNDAPVNSVPGNQTTAENTTLEFSTTNGNVIIISDPDADGEEVKVTLTVTNGTLTLPSGPSDETLENTIVTGTQNYSDIAVAADGSFVVTWTDSALDEDAAGIFMQRFAADGTAIGSETQVNTYTTGSQEYSAVAMDDAGNFVVTWESFG